MNTPSHMLIGAAVFARRLDTRVTVAAMLGGVIPDIPLILMVVWSLWIAQIPPGVVFGQMYFSEEWQRLFAIDHSFALWGGLFALGQWRAMPVLRAFAGAALLHAGIDFLVHHDDARRQLWPFSSYVFHSPVSYWDRAHFGGIVAPLEAMLDVICAVILVRRLTRLWQRVVVSLAAAVVAVPMVVFLFLPFPVDMDDHGPAVLPQTARAAG
jgi:membrane-bound metal-dependent hydrolase YbcI (DUF457 family)